MPKLHDEVIINGMRLRNRIAMPPLTTNYGTPEGLVTQEIIEFYSERSKDVGLVIVEASAVRADGRIVPNSLGLWADDQVEGMARLVNAIKDLGAAAVVQINHAGARSIPSEGDLQVASPSGFRFRTDVDPVAMTPAQIDQMVMDFADAAKRAAVAGFDGVEIHGAHFYLISQFLSPLTNQRDDRYGGDVRARTAFAQEVIRATRERLGGQYPILFRLNAQENVEGGLTREEALEISRLLADAGVDALDVSVIANSTWKEVDSGRLLVASSALSKEQAAGANVQLTVAVRETTRLPVIAVGKLAEGNLADQTVHEMPIDIVAIGRQMIVDPDAARKLLAGKSHEIIACEECMTCFASLGAGKAMACKVNRNLPRPSRSR